MLVYSTIIILFLFVVGLVTSRSNTALLFQLLLLPIALYLISEIVKIRRSEIDFKPSVLIIAVLGFILLTIISIANISNFEPEKPSVANNKSITTISLTENEGVQPEESKYIFIELNSDTGFVNIRSEANSNSESIGQAIQGERFELIEEMEEWYKIKTTKAVGYINKDFAVKN